MPLASNLIQGYDKKDLFAEEIKLTATKSKSWKDEFLKKIQTIFCNSKTNLKRWVRSFFPKI